MSSMLSGSSGVVDTGVGALAATKARICEPRWKWRRMSQLASGETKRFMLKASRSEEHTSELQSQSNLVCRLLLEKKKNSLTHRHPPHTPQRQAPTARRSPPLRRHTRHSARSSRPLAPCRPSLQSG